MRFQICLLIALLCLGPVAAQAQERFGAITFSRESNGRYAWGLSYGHPTLAQARDRARWECQSRGGSGCFEAGWFQNSCGALALGDANGYGTGWGATIPVARNNAINECRRYNRRCRIIASAC